MGRSRRLEVGHIARADGAKAFAAVPGLLTSLPKVGGKRDELHVQASILAEVRTAADAARS